MIIVFYCTFGASWGCPNTRRPMIEVVDKQAVYGHDGDPFRNGDIGIRDWRLGRGESEDMLVSNGSGVDCSLLRCHQQSEAVANLQPLERINGGTEPSEVRL